MASSPIQQSTRAQAGQPPTNELAESTEQFLAYLREVRRGTRVLVSDRNRVVAELHEPRAGHAVEDPIDPRLAEWIDAGIVSPPTAPKTKLPVSPVQLEGESATRLLDEDRGETE